MEFENKFREEKAFLNGENLIEWDSSQFHYYLTSLQYLYFNGLVYSKYNKLFQPFAFGYNSYARHCMHCISKLRLTKDPNYRPSSKIEEFILSNYAFFKNELPTPAPSQIREVDISNLFSPAKYSAINNKYFAPLNSLYTDINKKNRGKGIDALLLTNSLVDMGYNKGFSDADMVIILNSDIFNDIAGLKFTQKSIIGLSKYLYLFDPLQHHGFFIISPLDRLYYPEANYPLLLFEKTKSFYTTQSKLEFYCRDDSFEKRLAIYKSIKTLSSFVNVPNNKFNNLFLLKRYISTITLMPVLYSQLLGTYIYKKDAFDNLDELFGQNTSLFRLAEEIRASFPNPSRISYLPSCVHPSIANQIHGSFYRKKLWFDLNQLKKHTTTFLDSFVPNYFN